MIVLGQLAVTEFWLPRECDPPGTALVLKCPGCYRLQQVLSPQSIAVYNNIDGHRIINACMSCRACGQPVGLIVDDTNKIKIPTRKHPDDPVGTFQLQGYGQLVGNNVV